MASYFIYRLFLSKNKAIEKVPVFPHILGEDGHCIGQHPSYGWMDIIHFQ